MKSSLKMLLAALLVVSMLQAQIPSHQVLDLPYLKRSVLKAEQSAYKDSLYKKYEGMFTRRVDLDSYVKSLIGLNEYFFEAGSIYYNWTEAEQYLLGICKATLKEKCTSEMKVRLVRSAEDNAFMVEDGTIYMNVGLLANCTNEAELAAVIGHEYAHYEHKDSYRSFLDYQKMKKNENPVIPYGGRKFFRNSRRHETEADETSMALLKASNFNPDGFVSQFSRFRIMEEKYEKSKTYEPTFLSTHPSSEDRVAKAKKTLGGFDTSGRSHFIVDAAKFLKIKRQAIDESILLFLQHLDFQKASELCYRELLFFPNDEFYLFYIAECIRRAMLQDPKIAGQLFITDIYRIYSKTVWNSAWRPAAISTVSKRKLTDTDLRHLVNFNMQKILFTNDEFPVSSLPVSYLNNKDTIPFVTYADAYQFFYEKLKQNKYESYRFVEFMNQDKLTPLPFNSSLACLQKYNTYMSDMEKFYVLPEKNGFVIGEVKGSQTDVYMVGGYSRTELDADSMRKVVSDLFDKKSSDQYEALTFDSVMYTKRNKLLLYIDALLEKYSDEDIRLKDRKAFEINKRNEFKLDPLKTAPELVEILLENKFASLALVDVNIMFQQMPEMPMQSMYTSMMGSLGSKAMAEVHFVLNIHYIDYKNKMIRQSITSHTFSKKDGCEWYLGEMMIKELEKLRGQ